MRRLFPSHCGGIALWIAVVVASFGVLARYELDAAAATTVPVQWPVDTASELSTEGFTLLVFLHPQCPCSRATVRELERVLSAEPDAFATTVWMRDSSQHDLSWTQGALWAAARRLPGATVRVDVDAREARRFQALTSGHCIVFDSDGSRRFSGGVTPSRGHEGDSLGGTALRQLSHCAAAESVESLVFGCPIVAVSENEQ